MSKEKAHTWLVQLTQLESRCERLSAFAALGLDNGEFFNWALTLVEENVKALDAIEGLLSYEERYSLFSWAERAQSPYTIEA